MANVFLVFEVYRISPYCVFVVLVMEFVIRLKFKSSGNTQGLIRALQIFHMLRRGEIKLYDVARNIARRRNREVPQLGVGVCTMSNSSPQTP